MLRTAFVLEALGAATLLAPTAGTAQKTRAKAGGLTLGEKFEGELGETKSSLACLSPDGGTSVVTGYVTSIPVTLKAGQGLTATATVVGKDRRVCMHLMDPTGKKIGASVFTKRTSKLTHEEVSATGRYTMPVPMSVAPSS